MLLLHLILVHVIIEKEGQQRDLCDQIGEIIKSKLCTFTDLYECKSCSCLSFSHELVHSGKYLSLSTAPLNWDCSECYPPQVFHFMLSSASYNPTSEYLNYPFKDDGIVARASLIFPLWLQLQEPYTLKLKQLKS